MRYCKSYLVFPRCRTLPSLPARSMTTRPATEESTGEIMPEVENAGTGGLQAINFFFHADSPLRLLLLVSSLAALLILVTGSQSELVPAYGFDRPYFVYRSVDFEESPAFKYLLAALVVTCSYAAFTLITSANVVRTSSSPSTKLLFQLVLFDALMAGLLASATGAGGAVGHLGLKGNSNAGWNKICNIYDIFCRHITGAVAASLFASIVLVALVVLSAYSLYRCSR